MVRTFFIATCLAGLATSGYGRTPVTQLLDGEIIELGQLKSPAHKNDDTTIHVYSRLALNDVLAMPATSLKDLIAQTNALSRVYEKEPPKPVEKEFSDLLQQVDPQLVAAAPQVPTYRCKAGCQESGLVKEDIPTARLVSVASQAAEAEIMELRIDEQGVNVGPVKFARVSGELQVVFTDEGLRSHYQLFVRNPGLLSFDKTTMKFTPLAEGLTEIFVVSKGEMRIVPVQIGGSDDKALSVPEALTKIDSIYSYENENQLAYLELSEKQPQPRPRVISPVDPSTDTNEPRSGEYGAGDQSPIDTTPNFRLATVSRDLSDVAIQVVDERTRLQESRIYPVIGAKGRLVGSNVSAATDMKGMMTFADLPSQARFLVALEHRSIMPALTEVSLYTGLENTLMLRTLSRRGFDIYARSSGYSYQTHLGSLCGVTWGADARTNIDGLSARLVGLDQAATYSDYNGYPGLHGVTGPDGRFCFFELPSDLYEVQILDGDVVIMSAFVPIFAGYHSEEDFILTTGEPVEITLAGMPTVNEQLYHDGLPGGIRSVDSVHMLTSGQDQDWLPSGAGRMVFAEPLPVFKDRLYTVVYSGEFQKTLHSIDLNRHIKGDGLPIFHQGFIEDLYTELSYDGNYTPIAMDPDLGSLIIQAGAFENMALTNGSFEVFDHRGVTLNQEAWIYGNPAGGVLRSVFFNLPRGYYTVVLKSEAGDWLDINTVVVDEGATSVVQLGAALVATYDSAH